MTILSVGKGVEELELSSCITDENMKWYNHFGTQHVGFLEN